MAPRIRTQMLWLTYQMMRPGDPIQGPFDGCDVFGRCVSCPIGVHLTSEFWDGADARRERREEGLTAPANPEESLTSSRSARTLRLLPRSGHGRS